MTKAMTIESVIRNVSYHIKDVRVGEIHDSRQTHLVHSIPKIYVDEIKTELRKYGVNKFRKVSRSNGVDVILCFNADKSILPVVGHWSER